MSGPAGRRRRAAPLLAGGIAVAAVAPSLPAARAAGTTVAIEQRAFNPSPVSVHVGDTVTWRNTSDDDHNVRGGPVDSPVLHPGNTFSFTFTKAGTVDYVCDLHPMMQAKVVVS
ncbi:MAG TPA: plastocyanin/azurin family copper-binding protein [Acidimicrobiia bacterium]|nr:plastocyanin/azurin family copper-binding protein [Acidimicrobiia bacterium]